MEEIKAVAQETPQETPIDREELLKKVDEYLNIEEIVIKYNGVKVPNNPSQLSVELSALRHLKTVIESRISQLENEWTVFMEKNRVANSLLAPQSQE